MCASLGPTQECSKGSTPHRCLALFRENVGIVRNFRILWASIPKYQRMELLIQLLKEKNGFKIMGVVLCQQAFQMVSGVTSNQLQLAREAIAKGQITVLSKQEGLSRLSIRSQSKPPRYIEPWHVWIFDLLLLLKAFVSACFWHEWVLRMPVCGWSNMQNCMVNNLRWMGVCICPMDGNPNTMPCMLLSARKKIFLDWISDRLHKWRSLKFGGLNAHTSK